jgi:hypothetical protein
MDKKIDNKKQGKPEAPRIEGVDESACGQNPHWPGDGLLAPGKKDDTTLPELPNHPTANGQ